MGININVEIFAGSTIEEACAECQRVADVLRIVVRAKFNGVTLMAKPGGSAYLLRDRWEREFARDIPYKIVTSL